jgi:hypothetical protein
MNQFLAIHPMAAIFGAITWLLAIGALWLRGMVESGQPGETVRGLHHDTEHLSF